MKTAYGPAVVTRGLMPITAGRPIDTLVNTACVAVLNDIDPTNDCSTVEIPVDELLASVVVRCANDIAYLCGNPDMVDEAFAMLKEAGLPVPHIRREKYVSSR